MLCTTNTYACIGSRAMGILHTMQKCASHYTSHCNVKRASSADNVVQIITYSHHRYAQVSCTACTHMSSDTKHLDTQWHSHTHRHTNAHTYIAQLVASYAAEIPDPDLHPVPEIRPLDPVVAADLTIIAEESFWGKDLPAGRWLHRGLESSLGRLTHRHVLRHQGQPELCRHVQRHPGAAPPRAQDRMRDPNPSGHARGGGPVGGGGGGCTASSGSQAMPC